MSVPVRWVMRTDATALPPWTTGRKVAEAVLADARQVVVVVEDARPLGVLTCRDVPATGQRRAVRRAATARDLVTRPAVVVDEDTAVQDAAQLAHDAGVQHLAVVDAEGRLAGLVSRHELLRAYGRPDAQVEDEIRRQVIEGLYRLPPGAVNVTVCDGVVTLSGRVDSEKSHDGLVAAIRLVRGVGAVADALTVGAPAGDAALETAAG